MNDTPEYIARTALVYDVMEQASAAMRTAKQAGDKPAYDTARARYGAAQTKLRELGA